MNHARYNKQQNTTLYYFRTQCLNKMKNGEDIDLGQEMDLDVADCQNYKFRVGETVVLVKDRFAP